MVKELLGIGPLVLAKLPRLTRRDDSDHSRPDLVPVAELGERFGSFDHEVLHLLVVCAKKRGGGGQPSWLMPQEWRREGKYAPLPVRRATVRSSALTIPMSFARFFASCVDSNLRSESGGFQHGSRRGGATHEEFREGGTYTPSSRKRLMFHMLSRAVGELDTRMMGCCWPVPFASPQTKETLSASTTQHDQERNRKERRGGETHVASLLRSLAEDQPPPRLLPHSDLHLSNQPVHSLPS